MYKLTENKAIVNAVKEKIKTENLMIGEREDIYSETSYGSLTMRPYVISDNNINAFYDASDNLVFVLEMLITLFVIAL